jgi:hypothetical protein
MKLDNFITILLQSKYIAFEIPMDIIYLASEGPVNHNDMEVLIWAAKGIIA